MDCRQAKKKLIKFAEALLTADEEEALREHVNRCPSCARLILAEQLLADDIKQIRGVPPPRPMTVGRIREGIIIRERNLKNTTLGVRIMRQVSDTVYRRPRLSLAAATVFTLLLASILVPVRTAPPAGYEVAFAAPGSGLALNLENAEKMLAALDLDDARVEVSKADSGVEYRIVPLDDSVKVQRLITLLDSLGGRRVRSKAASTKSGDRTIWQLLLDDTEPETAILRRADDTGKRAGTISLNVDKILKGNILLWMPIGNQTNDSLRGLLLDRKGNKTNIQIVGGLSGMSTDDCGWHQFLNNSTLNTQTPDGEQVTFDLCEIEDVRKLEKMGYNFVSMEWDTPGQVPIPGMGPKLNKVKFDPLGKNTIIEYMIPQAYEVQLQILDVHGRLVRNLLRSSPCPCIPVAGIYQIIWDGLDADGNPAEPGIYSCRFTAGDYVEILKVKIER